MINLIDPVTELYEGYQPSSETQEEDKLNPYGDTTYEDQEVFQVDNATGKTSTTTNLTEDQLWTVPEEYDIWKDTGVDRPSTPIFYKPFDDQKDRKMLLYSGGLILITAILVKMIL